MAQLKRVVVEKEDKTFNHREQVISKLSFSEANKLIIICLPSLALKV